MKKKTAGIAAILLALSALLGCGKNNSGYLKDINVARYVKFTADYNGIELNLAPKEAVSEADVLYMTLNTYNSVVTAQNGGVTDREARVGDTVNIDYCGKLDDVAFEGGTAQNQNLVLGSGSFIPGFEDGLVGVMPGETVNLYLTFPEGYQGNPELAGKEVVFTVTVNFLYASGKEDMRDDIVSGLTQGEYPTVEALEGYYRDYLERYAERDYNLAKENAVISALQGIAECKEAPKALVEKYAETIRASLEKQAASYGVDADTLCTYTYGMDAEAYIDMSAKASAEQGMIFQYIATEEGLILSDEELEQELIAFAAENGLESVDAMLQDTDKEDFREYFVYKRVIDYVVEHAVINVTAPGQ